MRKDWISVFALAGIVSFGAYACGSSDSSSTAVADAGVDAGRDAGSTPRADAAVDAGPVEGSSCANAITADLGAEVTGMHSHVWPLVLYSQCYGSAAGAQVYDLRGRRQ